MVTIFVGTEKQKFCIHKTLICRSSKFFDRAFNGGFIEATTGELNLPEDSPANFEQFVGWLYRSCVEFSLLQGNGTDSDLLQLIDLYNFGDSKLCTGLKNAVMDSIQNLLCEIYDDDNQILEVSEMKIAFMRTVDSVDSPVRLFFGHLLHWYMFGSKHDKWTPENVSDFLAACPEAIPYYVKVHHETSEYCIEQAEYHCENIKLEIRKNPMKRDEIDEECNDLFGDNFFHDRGK